MTEVDNTGWVLHRYLRALSVRVSRGTVQHLLAHSMGSSMRGISDALDTLHVLNAVYQLPSRDYFSQLDSPFIAMRKVDRNPFCLVTRRNDSIVVYQTSEGTKTVATEIFLKEWNGTVLVAEPTAETKQESFFRLKDVAYSLLRYKVLLLIVLILGVGLAYAVNSQLSNGYLVNLFVWSIGILLSLSVLYKERVNAGFLERFCHIGKVIDCNQVLHSQGAKLLGWSLGQLSFLYFSTFFLYAVFCPAVFYPIAAIGCLCALGFTAYSVFYQIAVLHKGCLLCMLVNLLVWANAFCLYLCSGDYGRRISPFHLFLFLCIGLFIALLIHAADRYRETQLGYVRMLERHATLLRPAAFQALLELEPSIQEDVPLDITINNDVKGENRVLIVTNPNCKNCKEVHKSLRLVSSQFPISILLLTYPNDETGKEVVRCTLSAYKNFGWEKAVGVLDKWLERRILQEDSEASLENEERRKQHLLYCLRHQFTQTPLVLINGRRLPMVYSLLNLRYVLT